VLAPAKTPNPEIAQLARYFMAALSAPEIKSKLVTMDSSTTGECGPAFASFIRTQYDETGRIIREAGIKAQ
jgi:tripartite-type tricarboxylate transporter receptor subunit TctC